MYFSPVERTSSRADSSCPRVVNGGLSTKKCLPAFNAASPTPNLRAGIPAFATSLIDGSERISPSEPAGLAFGNFATKAETFAGSGSHTSAHSAPAFSSPAAIA